MLKKSSKTIWVCSECGGEHLSWAGKCSFCGAWNSLREVKDELAISDKKVRTADYIKIKDVKSQTRSRLVSGIGEFDNVFGGGIVRGSLNLVGGNPGVGKSTLIWQVANALQTKVAYIAAEESPEQIKLRSSRLKKESSDVYIIAEPELNSALAAVREIKPEMVVVDSIQTVYDSEYPSVAGGILQVKQCALKLVSFAKKSGIAFIIIGHVTKEGEVAGPKTLEHLVDGVFYLEGESNIPERYLRSQKNRFGPVEELGVFKMTESGFVGEADFGQKKFARKLPSGIAIAAVNEGRRVYFIEIQSLIQKSVFGYPKRNAVGYDVNRLNMIVAILARTLKIDLSNFDIYLNVSQGYRIKDPSSDLAVAASLVSAFKNKELSGLDVYIGELDLAGRVSEVVNQNIKIKAARKLGFRPITSKNISSLKLK
jgi:DNA repair protein RadA/Sms